MEQGREAAHSFYFSLGRLLTAERRTLSPSDHVGEFCSKKPEDASLLEDVEVKKQKAERGLAIFISQIAVELRSLRRCQIDTFNLYFTCESGFPLTF